jgi:integrase
VEADILKGAWVPPSAGTTGFEQYAVTWLADRSDLRPRTQELYAYLLRRHVLPTLGIATLGGLTGGRIRAWHGQLVSDHPAIAPKAYRLLHTILSTAVEDRRIVVNPCQIKRASTEQPSERRVASIAEVESLAEAVPARYRTMVLLAAWCSMRFGELAALTRQRIDLVHGMIVVQETVTETNDGRRQIGRPKTDASRRTVVIPPHILPAVTAHLAAYVGPAPDALLFPAPEGEGYLRRSNFTRRVWKPALSATALSIRFHDLRHAGLTWAAATGATVAELMHRAGHASPRAALIYQHATEDRDRAIAAALSELRKPAEVVPITKGRSRPAPR